MPGRGSDAQESSRHEFAPEKTLDMPNKRQKTSTKTLAPSAIYSAKSKEKMEDSGTGEGDSDPMASGSTCGICFSEGGGTIRGCIDSCDHYFCFVCIMEWAKVESLCPLCKRRFGSIRRPAVRGILPSERVVSIPVRNQVYSDFGNETVGPSNPYADVSCSVCHSSLDENLLLLCDLCDSAAHTFCVGLGATVPEGDWYCVDCTISRNEHSRTQSDEDFSNQDDCRTYGTWQLAGSPVSTSEIVQDGTSDSSNRLSEIQIHERETNDGALPSGVYTAVSVTQVHSIFSSPETIRAELGARTLLRCRNLHDRIRILRENWNALQKGSLAFSSTLVDSCAMNKSREMNSTEIVSGSSSHAQFSSSSNNAKMTADSSVSSEIHSVPAAHDIKRAWKMLKIAKSVQGSLKGNISPIKRNISKEAGKLNTRSFISKDKTLNHNGPTSNISVKDYRHQPLEAGRGKCKYQSRETQFKQKPNNTTIKKILQIDRGTKRSHSSECIQSSTEKQDVNSVQQVVCHKEGQAPHDVVPARSCSHSGSCTCTCRKGLCGYLGYQMVMPNSRTSEDKNSDGSPQRSSDSAKSEVKSLVKLNLKLQCRYQRLGTDKFKKIARVATHSILAACGLEHSGSYAVPFSSFICKHTEQAKHLCKSNLMPNSCSECLDYFVKEVIHSVISEKIVV